MKRFLKIILAIVLTFGLFYLICQKVSFSEVIAVIGQIPGSYIAPILGLVVVTTVVKCFKWCYLVEKAVDPAPPWTTVVRSFFAGMSIGVVTPGRAGELGRILYIEGEGKLRLSSLVVVDKVFDVIAISTLAIPGCLYFLGVLKALILFGAITVGITCLLLLNRLPGIANKFGVVKFFSGAIEKIISGFSGLNTRLIINMLILSSVVYIALMVEFYLLIHCIEAISFKNVLLGQPLVVLTNIIPTMAGGLGVRFGAAAFIFSKFGISEVVAINAALMTFFLNSGIPALTGLLFVGGVKFGEQTPSVDATVAE